MIAAVFCFIFLFAVIGIWCVEIFDYVKKLETRVSDLEGMADKPQPRGTKV